MGRGRLLIIGSSRDKVRLSCETCGAHTLHDKAKIGHRAMCAVCGQYREIPDRRDQNIGHAPERRVALR